MGTSSQAHGIEWYRSKWRWRVKPPLASPWYLEKTGGRSSRFGSMAMRGGSFIHL